MRHLFLLLFVCALSSCKQSNDTTESPTNEVTETDSLTKDFREFKVLDSKYINVQETWAAFEEELKDFPEGAYVDLKPLVLEQDIPTLQNHIKEGRLTYEALTKFYLYRIRKFDRENKLSLNSVIALNPTVVEEARQKDRTLDRGTPEHLIYGMPILLKDNIDAEGMPTTAGAVILKDNNAKDAFIVNRLKKEGALILGKANLSEWAYFFCGDCPSGYSAIGGQTLNPYGRRVLDTGGSSSGSGVAVAANFCVAAVGSETSGSILSPASQNSAVGLKPTIGLVSRSGIVPISSTLDTAGPIAKNVTDAAILLDALFGEDKTDSKSIYNLWQSGFYYDGLQNTDLNGKRFGAIKRLMEDSLYVAALDVLRDQGAEIIEYEAKRPELNDFRRLLNLDMKKDLTAYLETYADTSIRARSVADVVKFNETDSLLVMPYGQRLFLGILEDSATDQEFSNIKNTLKTQGRHFFDQPMDSLKLDAVLSINNYHAGFAAVAEYPALTVPMGYAEENGAPKGLTFIGKRLQERQLLEYGLGYEQASKMRRAPEGYQ